jgi:hypothetical protein
LFNGRDLSGWTTWLRDSGRGDPRKVFTVNDGAIRISGDGYGYLATEREFDDFHLVVEFRWGQGVHAGRRGKARDSGIFLFARGPDGNSDDGEGAFMAALEVNLFEGATGDFLLIRGKDVDGTPLHPEFRVESSRRADADGWFWWEPGGVPRTLERWGRVNWKRKSVDWADRFGFRGEHDVEKLAGEWNRVEVTSADGAVAVRVNGILVNAAEAVRPRKGKILLQCEGAEVFFRRVEVTEATGEVATDLRPGPP